jgi:acetyltransferase-like isoleucine patch superfamily enzyme
MKKNIKCRLKLKLSSLVFRLLQSYLRSNPAANYPAFVSMLNETAQAAFKSAVPHLGSDSCVTHPFYLKNPKYFHIGNGFCAQPGLRIEAWDQFIEEKFQPIIKIGNRVGLNWNVHIGAINRIEIGDDVLVGSNVLITDHAHGSAEGAILKPIDRPLKSKGPVVIEANVWIGEGVCILPGVHIGKGAIIGANAVVTCNIPAGAVVGGVPARPIN